MEEQGDSFTYTYSAKRREEVEYIRKKYLPAEEDKLGELRRLDKSALRPGRVAGLSVGILGILLLGVGLCCVLVWKDYFALGVVTGLIGMGVAGTAYPLYCAVTRRRRALLAPRILQLSQELMGTE